MHAWWANTISLALTVNCQKRYKLELNSHIYLTLAHSDSINLVWNIHLTLHSNDWAWYLTNYKRECTHCSAVVEIPLGKTTLNVLHCQNDLFRRALFWMNSLLIHKTYREYSLLVVIAVSIPINVSVFLFTYSKYWLRLGDNDGACLYTVWLALCTSITHFIASFHWDFLRVDWNAFSRADTHYYSSRRQITDNWNWCVYRKNKNFILKIENSHLWNVTNYNLLKYHSYI